MRTACLAAFVLASTGASAAEPFPRALQGVWGVSAEECADAEGPNFNTVIAGAALDQYETRCRATAMHRQGEVAEARVACSTEGERFTGTARLSPTPQGGMVLEMRSAYFKGGRRTLALIRCKAR